MKLKLLMGASGYGKTYKLYDMIIKDAAGNYEDANRRYIVVVPEQSSMQAQKDIVRMHPNGGMFNIDVLTFGRMCYRIFDELGISPARSIDDTGKNLVIRKIMDSVKDELKIIKAGRNQGFVSEVKSMVSELKQYGVKPDGLEEIAGKIEAGDRLKQKLIDISRIYKAFEEYINGRYTTVEDRPETMLSVMERSGFFKGADVVFDGFTGFTPVQYRIIEQIMKVARQVTITVTLPEDEPYNVIYGDEDLFAMSKTMISKAVRIAEECGAGIEYARIEPDYDKFRFAKSDALGFLERNIFRYNGKKFDKPTEDIRFARPDNPTDELVCTASDILRQVREKGLRFRDIAIVVGDMEMYADDAVRIFTESGIPFFVDAKRSIMGNPLVEYVRSAIEIITSNYSYESIFRFLKNGLCDIADDDVDIAENYVIAYGIRGYKAWSENFVRRYPGKEKNMTTVNAVRKLLVDKINILKDAFSDKEASAGKYVRAIYEFMEQENLYDKMENFAADMEEAAGTDMYMRARADGYRQVYAGVLGLLDQMYALMGDEKISVQDLAQIIDAGFEEIKVGIIPPSVDCVTLGDIERTRLEHVKMLYILGVNEGVIPKLSTSKGVLSDNERKILGDNKVELSPTPREKIFIQNFYLYLNMTEPECGLYLMSHRFDNAGKECRVSRVYTMVESMYPGVKAENVRSAMAHITSAEAGRHMITDSTDMLMYYMMHEPYKKEIDRLVGVFAAEEEPDSLTRKASEELYAQLKTGSISRIEKYAGCAFEHFAGYGLELEERRMYELSAADMGVVFHRAIEIISVRLKSEGRNFADLTDEEIYTVAETAVMDASVDFSQSYFSDNSTNAYIKKRIIDMTARTVWALGRQLKSGIFKPVEFEEDFYRKEGDVLIKGKIDRVDIAEEKDKIHVKVIDYKSGKNEFSADKLYVGLKLQLMLYLDAMLKKAAGKYPDKQIIAAGAFYNHIDNPIIAGERDRSAEKYEKALLESMRPGGVVSVESVYLMDDWDEGKSLCTPASKRYGKLALGRNVFTDRQLRCLADYAAGKLAGLEHEIREGNVKAEPYEGECDYCPYGGICHMGSDMPKTRQVPKISGREDMWQQFGYREED